MCAYIAKLVPSDILGDRYRIVSILGQGGMGVVYLAEDLKLHGKKWAIKETIHTGMDHQKFVDEAEILMKLDHPQLPHIVDYFPPDAEGYSYLVMDYIQGKTLQQCFEEEKGQFHVQRILKYCMQICDLFIYLHGYRPKPIIYRDLKPANVMIDVQDQVRLIDFGVARNFKPGKQMDTIPLGTLGFAAPEQFEQAQTDHRTDLYHLGALMYYLLSGGHYYCLSQQSLSVYRRDLPPGLVPLVERLLMSDPDQRYQSAEDVKRDLAKVINADSYSGSTTLHTTISSRVIVVGSLYPGAGSTFVSMALARVMHHCQIENCVIEFPGVEPELYRLLFGEKDAPDAYCFLMDRLDSCDLMKKTSEWKSGYTTWYPLHPQSHLKEKHQAVHLYKMLLSAKQPITIIDVSDQWLDPNVQQLCHEADEILVVSDAFLHKWNSTSSQQRLQIACQLEEKGKSVHFMANKMLRHPLMREWVRSFPWPPICRIPYIPYETIISSVWKGALVHDHHEIFPKLWDAFFPFIQRIVPETSFQLKHRKKMRLFITKK